MNVYPIPDTMLGRISPFTKLGNKKNEVQRVTQLVHMASGFEPVSVSLQSLASFRETILYSKCRLKIYAEES